MLCFIRRDRECAHQEVQKKKRSKKQCDYHTSILQESQTVIPIRSLRKMEKSAKNEKSAKDNGQKKNESALYTVDCSSYHNNITVSEHVYSINSYLVYYVML